MDTNLCRRCGKVPAPNIGELQVCDACAVWIYTKKVAPARARGALDIAANVIMRKYGRIKPLVRVEC